MYLFQTETCYPYGLQSQGSQYTVEFILKSAHFSSVQFRPKK